MEKYGTYLIFKNTQTGEIKRLPVGTKLDDLVKTAEANDWVELDHDPEEVKDDE